MNKFELENQSLLKNFLNRKFIKNGLNKDVPVDIELFITADCNLGCTYCYLQNQKEGLYPKEMRNMNTILKNTKIFFDWFDENEINAILHIFSGEFFNLGKYTFEILDIIYDYVNNENRKGKVSGISIPTNMSFILDNKLTEEIEKYILKFKNINVNIGLSASVDGLHLEKSTRPMNVKTDNRDEIYYDKLFKFCAKYGIGLHPMIASFGIENWIENYNWMRDMSKRYLNDRPIMMLEVRDDDWTDGTINEFLKFIDHLIHDEFVNSYDSNKKAFAKRVFLKPIVSYDNLSLVYRGGESDKISCRMQSSLYIRMGDLSIVPCHRLSYDLFNYGKFEVNNDKIVNIVPGNISLMTAIYSMKGSNLPLCESCNIKRFCPKGCLGSQYEISKEPFLPNESVCNMYKKKIEFQFRKYHELGIIAEAMNINMIPELKSEIKKLCKEYKLL